MSEPKKMKLGLSGIASVVDSPLSRSVGEAQFPLVVEHGGGGSSLADSLAWVTENQPEIERLLRQSGVILFRGFPLKTPEDFDAFVCAFKGWEDLSYENSLSFA